MDAASTRPINALSLTAKHFVELSRRAYLDQAFPSLEYGQVYRGTLHALPDGRSLFTSNDLEAFAGPPDRARRRSVQNAEVSIARIGPDPRSVEIYSESEKQSRSRRR